ncbi:MAG: hypothetical protein R3F62_25500 [Planctomycetota bacterium]
MSAARPSPLLRWGPRGLLGLGWGGVLWLAFRTDPTRWTARTDLDGWIETHPSLLALIWSLPALIAGLWLLRAAPVAPRPPVPRGWPGAALRGVALCGVLSLAFTAYLLLGGYGLWYTYDYTSVGTAALVAPLLGLTSLVETRPAETPGARAGWSALAGVSAVLALLVAWIQREYVNELFLRDLDWATRKALETAGWLGEDPVWTFWHFAWIGVVWGAVLGARLRPRGRRLELSLAAAGVGAAWAVPRAYAADAVIAFGALSLCALTPLAFRLGDALQTRGAAWLREDA